MSSNESDENRPSREVAYRMFAAEFDDASFSYSESDEERAPNYVVTPTGARVNRMFAVGVLTEVEPVNDDVLRGRIVDPTGAFVSYAGQYQPDEMAFLDRASPPAFVALSGKARTFQPDDSDRVFTSVRPESMSRVDADTRDRWTVSTAEATLHRVGVMAAALQSGLRGGDLSDALREAGVDEPLSKGVPLAIEHYGTTPGYLAALRRLALDALEVVANERDSARPLDVEPDATGNEADLAVLAADLDLAAPVRDEESVASAAATPETGTDASESVEAATEPTSETATEPTTTDAVDETAAVDDDAADVGSEPTPSASADAADTDTVEAGESVPEFDETTPTRETEPTDTAVQPSTGDAGEGAASEPAATAPTSSETVSEPESTEPPTGVGETAESEAPEPTSPTSTGDELGDFDSGSAEPSDRTGESDDIGDFDAGGSVSEPESGSESASTSTEPASSASADERSAPVADTSADADTETTADSTAATATDTGTDDDGMYELDADERAEIEAEFGTEFSTGSEVAPAGEADIDVPSVEELEEEIDEELGSAESAPESSEPAVESDPATAADAATESESGPAPDAAAAGDEDGDGAADVDLETVAVEAMEALDDGDGASRETVVAHVVDEYGAAPDAVEDAIQSALMSGQCYEPTEDSLKAI